MNIWHVLTLDDFLNLWPFFLEGLEMLNSPAGGGGSVSKDRFFKTLLRVALGDHSEGTIIVAESKAGKPLGFVVLMNNTFLFDVRAALVFAVYAVKNNPAVIPMLMKEHKLWCKQHGYEKVFAASRRVSGAAMRLFEWKWGFKRDCIVFVQNL